MGEQQRRCCSGEAEEEQKAQPPSGEHGYTEPGIYSDLEGGALRIGTDCSGLDTPVLARMAMKIKYRHVLSCDIEPHVLRHLEASVAKGVRI